LYLFSAAQSLEVAEDDKEKDKNSTRLQQQQQQLEQDQQNMDQSPREPQYVRVRVANACDSCKIRKGTFWTQSAGKFIQTERQDKTAL
jgi:hypothetical protein